MCVLVMSVWNECVWDMGLLDKTVRSEYENIVVEVFVYEKRVCEIWVCDI